MGAACGVARAVGGASEVALELSEGLLALRFEGGLTGFEVRGLLHQGHQAADLDGERQGRGAQVSIPSD